MAGAGQRDVGKAQLLAALLDVVLVHMGAVLVAGQAHVDRTPGLLIVEVDGLALVGEAPGVPQERAVDDGELEALAAVEGEHLDGVGIGVQAAGALVV